MHLLDVEQFSLCLVKIFMIDSLFLFEFLAKTVTPAATSPNFQSLKDLRPWVQILLFVQLFISYAVLFILVACANYNSNFVPFNLLHLFCLSPNPPLLC